MDADCGIAKHRFGTSRAERNAVTRRLTRIVDHGIIHRPEVTVDLFVVDFIIGNSGLQERIPVHQTLTAIDQSVFEHLEECLTHSARANIIQRESHTSPVTARTQTFQLAENSFFVRILPGPDPLDECVAANVMPGQTLFFEHPFFDDRLSRNPRVIGPRHPQSFIPLHPTPASQQVLQRPVERMPHMQRTRHVRQRDHDHMRRLGMRITRLWRIGVEVTSLFPKRGPTCFSLGGFVLLWDFGRH